MITLSFMIIRLLWPKYFRKRIEYLWQEAYTVNSGQQVKVKVAQSCPTLCDPMYYTVHGILQARILEWIAFPFSRRSSQGFPHCRWILYQMSHQGSPRILEWEAYPFSRGSSWPRNQTRVSCIAGQFFTNWATEKTYRDSWLLAKKRTGFLRTGEE